jgi:hypothetical protein
MKEHLEESTSIFEHPEQYESFMDINIFFPISSVLATPLRKLGMTPNGITVLSGLIRLYVIFLLSVNKVEYACLFLIIGYTFDCVDGAMARKYKMGSNYGMVFDLVSDTVILGLITLYILIDKGINWQTIGIIIVGCSQIIWSFICPAITSYKTLGTDDFYTKKQEELKDESYLLSDVYLYLMKNQYNNYKLLFPTYDHDKLHKWITIIKELGGPGNAMCILSYLMYNLYKQ